MNPDDFPPRGDDPNPYAPPQTDLRGRPAFTLAGPVAGFEPVEPFSIGGVIGRAWRLFHARMGVCLAIVIGVGAMSLGYQFVGNLLVVGLSKGVDSAAFAVLAQVVYFLGNIALTYFLTAGETVALLKLARDRDASFEDVFGAGRFFWRMLGASILAGLIALAALVACALPAVVAVVAIVAAQGNDPTVPVVAGVALGLVGLAGYVFVVMHLLQYSFVLVDTDCGVVEALQRSYEISRGRVGEMFVIAVLASLIGVSGVFACGVGLIFTVPLSMLIYSCAYVCLTGRGPAVVGDGGGGKPPRTDLEFIDFTS